MKIPITHTYNLESIATMWSFSESSFVHEKHSDFYFFDKNVWLMISRATQLSRAFLKLNTLNVSCAISQQIYVQYCYPCHWHWLTIYRRVFVTNDAVIVLNIINIDYLLIEEYL